MEGILFSASLTSLQTDGFDEKAERDRLQIVEETDFMEVMAIDM